VEFTLKRALYVLSLCLIMCAAAAGYETQVREREGEVLALARAYETAGFEIAGIVTVRFTVGTDGVVRDAYIVASMVMNPAFERDLLELVSGWTFSNPEKCDVVITYPFVFHKQDYKRGLAAVLIGHYGAGWGAEECAAEVVRRARDNESIAVREYSRVRDEFSDAAGLMIISVYVDSEGGLSRTSCSYSEIEEPIFKDKIRNWLGCNLPVGEYPDARIIKIALAFEPKGGATAKPLTEAEFKKVALAYEEFVYYIYESSVEESTEAGLTVDLTVTPGGKVNSVDTVESTIADANLENEILKAIYGWEFPRGVETVTYEYRFDF
jgi:TonB family protein